MVHVQTSRTSRHEWERIQYELGTIAHPEIWRDEDWLELRTSWKRWHVCCTPQITKKKITSRGQYKAQVLSRYHRPTQNRKQYISNNNIKPTKYLTGDNNKYHNHWPQHQAHLWGLKPPHHTHLGIRFFKPEYISIIQDSFSLLSWCRNVTLRSPQYSFILLSWCLNVTLRSPTILVSECDTPIPYYPGVRT